MEAPPDPPTPVVEGSGKSTAETQCEGMITCGEMLAMMAKQKKMKKEQQKGQKKVKLRHRKDLFLLTASVQALCAMPVRLTRGPIFPSFNWITGSLLPHSSCHPNY
jgi:hypothetical protein